MQIKSQGHVKTQVLCKLGWLNKTPGSVLQNQNELHTMTPRMSQFFLGALLSDLFIASFARHWRDRSSEAGTQ